MRDHRFVDQIVEDANDWLKSTGSTHRFRESATTESGYPALDLLDPADGDLMLGTIGAMLLSTVLKAGQMHSFTRALMFSYLMGKGG